MEVNRDNGTDGASLKPVSSLRSHFEKISNLDLTPHANPRRSTPVDDIGKKAKTGDLTRSSPPPTRSGTLANPHELSNQSPHFRPHTGLASSQRPLSMTSLSTPPFPPPVQIRSPSPAPKDVRSSHVTHSNSLQTLQSNNYSGRLGSPLPHRNASTSSIGSSDAYLKGQMPQRAPAQVPKGSVPIQPSLAQVAPHENDVAATRGRTVPPPVNRADKPKIVLKPAESDGKNGLRPSSPFVDERTSPFSTPPSSDEDKGQARNTALGSPLSKAVDLNLPSHMANIPSSAANARSERPGPSRTLDARAQGFSQTLPNPAHVIEAKPKLPSRTQWKDAGRLGTATSTISPLIPKNLPTSRSKTFDESEPRSGLPTPPKRSALYTDPHTPMQGSPGLKALPRPEKEIVKPIEVDPIPDANPSDTPDVSDINRRIPYCPAGARSIEVGHDARLLDICGRHLCTAGNVTRVWDVMTGEILLSISPTEREIKVTALAFKPGARSSDEGSIFWLGTNGGDLQEVDIASQSVLYTKSGAHERREIAKIHRYQNTMWTLDDGGKLCVWHGDESGLPSLHSSHTSHRVQKGHACSLIIQGCLWLASGREIRVYKPAAGDSAGFNVSKDPLIQPQIGSITSGSVVGDQIDRVYFGHSDGKVSVYSTIDYTCSAIISIGVYKINSLVGTGSYLWAAFSIGIISVYDTRSHPWTTKKSWTAHQSSPIHSLVVDRSSLWKTGTSRLVSTGSDNAVRFWDGTLQDDWLEQDMRALDVKYCTFRELTALTMSWNAGAATPAHLRHEQSDSSFFRDLLNVKASPDMLIFGFQELVDLEDKKLTAKTLFKANKKKDPAEQEHMSRQYRAWRDFLVKSVDECTQPNDPYFLVHTANLVGLFSCVFLKMSQRRRLSHISTGEVKRGIGGLHGNKGALIIRFVLDDSSICLVNCHLAAGQTQTNNRNNDITAILDSEALPAETDVDVPSHHFRSGGNGSMILDHEICIFNGDLNYRIDTMGRDTVIKAVNANNLSKLLERDQLLVSRRRNPMLGLRSLREAPISFAPTYKYDVGSDRYDTSEKRRAPAWCDRILYRGAGTIKQLNYQRRELRVSDHRPVTAEFRLRIKSISPEMRAQTREECEKRFLTHKERLSRDSKIEYLRDVLGVSVDEAKRLV